MQTVQTYAITKSHAHTHTFCNLCTTALESLPLCVSCCCLQWLL